MGHNTFVVVPCVRFRVEKNKQTEIYIISQANAKDSMEWTMPYYTPYVY